MHSSTRRHFIFSSAALTAAALAAPRSGYAANETIRVGIIGCRNRGPQVAEALLQSGHFSIGAIADADTAMFAHADKELGRHLDGAKREQDFQRLLEDPDIDAVVIATPDHWHAAMTALALDAGKHVYCEKPCSFDVRDSLLMQKALDAHPKLVAIAGTQQRSGQHFKDAREFVRSGGLGTVGFVRTWITHTRALIPVVPDGEPPATMDYELWVGPSRMRPYNPEKTHYNWHFVRDWGTGEMGNWGAHWIDIAAWYLDLGNPTAVSGHGGQLVVKDAKETPDTQTAIYEYPNLTMVWEQRLWTKNGVNREGSGTEFQGDKGGLVITRGGWTFTPNDGKSERHPGTEMMVAHANDFAGAIRGERQPVAPLSAGLHTANLCHLANMAVESGEKVVLHDDGSVKTTAGNDVPGWGRDYREPWREVQTRYSV
jgi:predicted dehydrogenase